MQKIINQPSNFVDEVVDGILKAHPKFLRPADAQRRALVRTDGPRDGNVAIVTGGGSGHLPLFLGYVGEGLCSGVAIGNVFSSPSADAMLAATKATHRDAGVLYLFGNYGGDRLNFEMAAELAEIEGIETATVLVTDDVASAPADRWGDRRGIAGLVFAYKCAGAAAERGDDLLTVARTAQETVDATRTMGVGLAPTILPEAGLPSFHLEDGEMELGIGIHGEPGVERGPLRTADDIADALVEATASDLGLLAGDRVAILVNGLGATPLEELYLLFRRAQHALEHRAIHIERTFIGEYATSLEMAGASITLLRLDDQRLKLLDAPAHSPLFPGWS